jgi:hypothetical protein
MAWLVAIALIVTFVVSSRARPADAGAGAPPGPATEVVYIATGVNYPDALAAASSAALGLGPVLLVQQDAVPTATIDELNRLEPDLILVVGGTAVISDGVVSTLQGLGFLPSVHRLSGDNRYETAAAVSNATFPTTGRYPRAAFAESDNVGDGVGGAEKNLLTAVVQAPAPGILVINAGADYVYDAGAAIVQCWVTMDGDLPANEVSGSRRFFDLDSTSTEDNCSTQTAINVDAGQHMLKLRTFQDADVTITNGAITVIWIPFNGYGAVPPLS